MFDWISQVLEKFWEYIKFWQIVESFEKGVLCRWGIAIKELEPGFHWKYPCADYVYTTIVTPDTINIKPITLTTADGKTISIGAVVEFDIVDIWKYLIDTNEARSNMRDVCLGVISDDVEDRDWEEIKKKTTRNAVQKKLSKACEQMGIRVINFYFTAKSITKSFSLSKE